jgi:hypothetical protein
MGDDNITTGGGLHTRSPHTLLNAVLMRISRAGCTLMCGVHVGITMQGSELCCQTQGGTGLQAKVVAYATM